MSNPSRRAFFAVDRIEGRFAILIGDDGREFEVPHAALPAGTAEGTILALPVDTDPPAWHQAEIDAEERERRLGQLRAQLKELRERDPGGDIIL